MTHSPARHVVGKLAVIAVVGILSSALVAAPAQAADDPLDPAFVAELTAKWTEYEVPAVQQLALLEKLRNGVTVDAMNASSVPTATTRVEDQDSIDTVMRYGDGSISVMSIQKPPTAGPGSVTPLSVGSCESKSGTKWTRCTAYGWFTAVVLSFKVTLDVGSPSLGKPATIISYNTPTLSCMFTSCTSPTFELIRKTQSGSTPARVNLVTNWTNLVGTGTTRLSLTAINGTATTN